MNETNKVNRTVDNMNIGNMNLEKGTIRKDIQMYAWDCVQNCTGGIFDVDDPNYNPDLVCPVNDQCSYIKRGKCAVQTKYLKTLYTSILGTYKYLDEAMLFKIGMQIIPLYVQLVKLQIVELSLARPTLITGKGSIAIHPVYKEIRETLKCIYTMWKDLDLSFTFHDKPGMKPVSPPSDSGSSEVLSPEEQKKLYEQGDPNFYKRLTASDGKSQAGVIR